MVRTGKPIDTYPLYAYRNGRVWFRTADLNYGPGDLLPLRGRPGHTQRDHGGERRPADIAASFQEAAIEVLAAKARRAARECGARSLMLSGGVAANAALREALRAVARELRAEFFAPPMDLNTDNAAVIGVAGYLASLKKKHLPFEAQGHLNL